MRELRDDITVKEIYDEFAKQFKLQAALITIAGVLYGDKNGPNDVELPASFYKEPKEEYKILTLARQIHEMGYEEGWKDGKKDRN